MRFLVTFVEQRWRATLSASSRDRNILLYITPLTAAMPHLLLYLQTNIYQQPIHIFYIFIAYVLDPQL